MLASLLGACLALAVAVMVVQSPALSSYIDGRAIPALSKKLNRQIDVGETHARIFFRPHVELTDVVIAGAPGEPALLSAGRASATVELWPFLVSLGKDIRISEVELDDATVNLVRRPDGTLNYEDVVRAFHPAHEQKPVEPAQPEKKSGETVLLDQFRVRRSRVTFIDRSHGEAERSSSVAASQLDALVRPRAGTGRPILDLKASVASKKQNVQLSISRQENDRLRARVSAVDVSLQDLRSEFPPAVAAVGTGGLATIHADVNQAAEGRYDLTGDARIEQLALAGRLARGSAAGSVQWDPKGQLSARADRIELTGPGLDLRGTASLASPPMHVTFDLRGPALDVKELKTALSEPKPKTTRPVEAASQHIRRSTAEVDGRLHIDRLEGLPLPFTNVNLHAGLAGGRATLETCTANLLEGTVDLSGSTVDLDPRLYHLIGRASQLELGGLLRGGGAAKPPLDGRVEATTDLRGRGTTWPELRPTLTGSGAVAVKEIALSPEIGSQLFGSIENELSRVGLGGTPASALEPRWTHGGQANARFQIARGSMQVDGLQAQMPFGHASLNGRVGLDGRLDLSGVVSLAPDFVGHLTGSKLVPTGPLGVPVQVAGTLDDPKVTPKVDIASIAKDLEHLPGGVPGIIPPRARVPHLPHLPLPFPK